MVTTKQLLDLVDQPPGVKGLIYVIQRTSVRDGSFGNISTLTSAQRALLDAVGNAPKPDRPAAYQHPRATVGISGRLRNPDGSEIKRGPLTAAEVLWLQRLPTDPAQISFADAQQLIKLNRDVTDPSEQLLLKSMVGPVMDYHDAKAAEVALVNARRTPPTAPAETLPALADVIAADNPDLRPHEALGRASEMLSEHLAARTHAQQVAEYNAQQRITELKTKASERTAVHRGFAPEAADPAPIAG